MAKIIWIIAIILPPALPKLAAKVQLSPLTSVADILSQREWFFIAIIIALFAFLFEVGKRTKRLEDERQPQLTSNDVQIWNNKGEFFVRVQLQNTSHVEELNGTIPYLDRIEAEDPLQEIKNMDFPVQLYTQLRLRDRLSADDPRTERAEPVNFGPEQKKWLEVFRITEAVERTIHIIEHDRTRDIIAIPVMYFKCKVSRAPNDIEFSLKYEEVSDGWQMTLVNEKGETIGPVKAELRDE